MILSRLTRFVWLWPMLVGAAFFSSGCGSSAQPARSVFDISPKERVLYERLLEQADGKVRYAESFDLTKLAMREIWPENPEQVRTILFFIHGTSAQSRLYLPLADTLKNHGIATVLLDLRGHGLSGGRRGHAPGIDALVRDVRIALDTIRHAYPGKNIVLGGHSLGAGLCVKFVEFFHERPSLYTRPDGMVLMSGGFIPNENCDSAEVRRVSQRQEGRSFANVNGWGLAAFLPAAYLDLHPRAIEVVLPNDSLVTKALQENLLTVNYSLQFFLASFPFQPKQTFRHIDFPILMLLGKDDELLKTCDAKYTYERAKSKVKDLYLLSETNHINIIWHSALAIADWLNQNISNSEKP
ncbi:alpha/beta fold hydrolase [Chloroherpeton thalassium]|nr:alpha/beta fold hydrolase [Chloroherpeton thalassium]